MYKSSSNPRPEQVGLNESEMQITANFGCGAEGGDGGPEMEGLEELREWELRIDYHLNLSPSLHHLSPRSPFSLHSPTSITASQGEDAEGSKKLMSTAESLGRGEWVSPHTVEVRPRLAAGNEPDVLVLELRRATGPKNSGEDPPVLAGDR